MLQAARDAGGTRRASPRAIAEQFAPVASIKPLGGERDANFLVETPSGSRRVLKIVSPDEAESAIPLQLAALQHLSGSAPDLPVPRIVPTLSGEAMLPLAQGGAWMLSFRAGTLLSDGQARKPALTALGEVTAALGIGLADFRHPLLDRHLVWRLDRAADAAARLPAITDREERGLAERALLAIVAAGDRLSGLPRQAIHGDLNPFNVVVDDTGGVAGLIDFGDLHHGWRAGELAIAACYHLGDAAGLAALLAGHRRRAALDEAERELLPMLMAARLGMTLAISASAAADRPKEAAYLRRNAPAALDGLRWLAADGSDRLAALIADTLA